MESNHRYKEMSRAAKKAAQHFQKVQTLKAMGPAGTAELKKMREVLDTRDDNHSKVTPGAAWNPEGTRKARGSSFKCDRINRTLKMKGVI